MKLHLRSSSTQTDDTPSIIDSMLSLMMALPEEEKYIVVNRMVQVLAARVNPAASVPDDFIKLSLRAMERLKLLGRENTVYGLVRGLGIMREDGSDSRLPAMKMPMHAWGFWSMFSAFTSLNQLIRYR